MNTTNLNSPRHRANQIVNNYSTGCAGTALSTGPLPGTSVALAGIEAKMCYEIARAYQQYPTMKECSTIIAGLAVASVGLKSIAIEAASFFPVIGWVAKSGIAYAGCQIVGMAIIDHYEDICR